MISSSSSSCWGPTIKLMIIMVPKHLVGGCPKALLVCSLSVQGELGWGWGRGEGERWGGGGGEWQGFIGRKSLHKSVASTTSLGRQFQKKMSAPPLELFKFPWLLKACRLSPEWQTPLSVPTTYYNWSSSSLPRSVGNIHFYSLAPSVRCLHMVWGCVCACACV